MQSVSPEQQGPYVVQAGRDHTVSYRQVRPYMERRADGEGKILKSAPNAQSHSHCLLMSFTIKIEGWEVFQPFQEVLNADTHLLHNLTYLLVHEFSMLPEHRGITCFIS